MAKFKKKVLEEGVYQSPDGVINITKDRIKHWAESFKKMKTAGLKIPIPWGHHSKAIPDYDEREFYESKYNGGYIEDLQSDKDGALVAIIDIPREEDSTRIGTSVKEVSPQIETAWKDGKGNVWSDVITHLALVTHPVVPGQDNFEAINDDPTPVGATRLSLKNKINKNGDSDMAKKADDEVVAKPEKEPKAKDNLFEGHANEHSGIDPELLDLLGSIGLIIPEDTTEEDFIPALKASAATLKHKLDEEGGNSKDEDDLLGGLDLSGLEDALGGAGGAEDAASKPAEENVEDMSAVDNKKGPVMEQQPAMSMSLNKNNLETELAAVKSQLESSHKDSLRNQVDLLLTQGKITPVIAERLKNEVGRYKLSLNGETSLVQSQIETFKLMPEGSAWGNDEKIRLSRASEESLPSEFKTLSEDDASRLAELQLKRAGKVGSLEF